VGLSRLLWELIAVRFSLLRAIRTLVAGGLLAWRPAPA
jgi:hypothetical protein